MDIKKYKKKKDKKEKNFLKSIINKIMLSLILFLSFLIGTRKINGFDEFIYKHVYSNSISFAKINSIYNKYLGGILPIKKIDDVQVFDEHISYSSKEKYLDGVKLTVNDNYLVPVLTDGIVIYKGNKNNYGKTIIIQDEKGIETWYSNIEIGNIELYDYVKKGDYLGEVLDNSLILIFKKDGEVEDYQKYI